MIERPFLSIPAKTACPGKLSLIFSKIFRATRLAGFKSSLLPSHTTVSSIMFLRSHMYACHHPSFLQVWYMLHNNRGMVAMVTCMNVKLHPSTDSTTSGVDDDRPVFYC